MKPAVFLNEDVLHRNAKTIQVLPQDWRVAVFAKATNEHFEVVQLRHRSLKKKEQGFKRLDIEPFSCIEEKA